MRIARPYAFVCVSALALVASVSCTPSDMLNPEFVSSLTGRGLSANLPDQAPGLLVAVENRTTRAAEITVSYRDSADNVQTYTTFLLAGDKSAQMLPCPITEITMGNVADLRISGARVALVDGAVASLATVPTLEVEPFGVLLREDVNYDCGDSIQFVLNPSSTTRTGFSTIAYFRRTQTN